MAPIPNTILAEKNNLTQAGAWPWLVDLTPAGSVTTYHYTNDTQAVVYGGVTYDPMPFRIDPIENTADGQLQALTITVQDIGLSLQSILRANNGLRNATVTITQVNTELLNQDFSADALTFQVSYCQNKYADIVLYCGVPGCIRSRVPEDQYLALQCRHDFRVPASTLQNMLAYSEALGHWSNYSLGATVTENTADVLAPDGTQTASKIVTPGGGAGGKIQYGAIQPAGKPYTVSIWMRGAVGGEQVGLSICDGNGSTKTLTTQWVRYTYTTTSRSSNQTNRLIQLTNATGITFYAWGAQAVRGTVPGLYWKTGSVSAETIEGDYSSRCGLVGKGVTAITMDPALVAQYLCNDNAANTVVADNVGGAFGRTGTASANTSTMTTTGKIGSALNFVTASARYVTIPDHATLRFAAGGTITMWVKWDGTAVSSGGASPSLFSRGGDPRCYYNASGTLYMRMGGTNDTISNAGALVNGTWVHLAFCFGATKAIYKNGVNITATPGDNRLPTSTAAWYLGAYTNASGFGGAALDDVRFYNRVLSAAEIQGIYNAGAGTELKNLAPGPINIWAGAHGFVTGDQVRLYGFGEWPVFNNDYTITKIDADNFTLDGTDGTGMLGVYTSGGKAGYAKCPRLLSRCRAMGRNTNYGGIAASRADAIRLAF